MKYGFLYPFNRKKKIHHTRLGISSKVSQLVSDDWGFHSKCLIQNPQSISWSLCDHEIEWICSARCKMQGISLRKQAGRGSESGPWVRAQKLELKCGHSSHHIRPKQGDGPGTWRSSELHGSNSRQGEHPARRQFTQYQPSVSSQRSVYSLLRSILSSGFLNYSLMCCFALTAWSLLTGSKAQVENGQPRASCMWIYFASTVFFKRLSSNAFGEDGYSPKAGRSGPPGRWGLSPAVSLTAEDQACLLPYIGVTLCKGYPT